METRVRSLAWGTLWPGLWGLGPMWRAYVVLCGREAFPSFGATLRKICGPLVLGERGTASTYLSTDVSTLF